MRALCIKLENNIESSITENFLGFSSKIRYRNPGLLFADISDSYQYFGSEENLFTELKNFTHEFYPQAKFAIANSPSTAQALTCGETKAVFLNPENESSILSSLPLNAIQNLEGLVAWSSLDEINDIIRFFKVMGCETIGDIIPFDIESFEERWGQLGGLLWKRIHGYEKQIISPHPNGLTYVDHIELNFSVSLLPYLLHSLENRLRSLINEIKDKNEEPTKLTIYLHCEYNYDAHLIEILPNGSECLNLIYIYEQLEQKLRSLDLSNPIKKIDLEFVSYKPLLGKIREWQNYHYKKKFNQSSLVSGHLKADSSNTDWNDISVAMSEEEHHYLKQEASFSELAPLPSNNLNFIDFFDHPQELSTYELNKYRFVNRIEQKFYGQDDCRENRGHLFYIATNSYHEKVCILFDILEDKYFLKGRLL